MRIATMIQTLRSQVVHPHLCRPHVRRTATGLLLAGLAALPAFAAETYTLKDLSVDDGRVYVKAGEITLTGTTLLRSEVEALVKAGKAADVVIRLAGAGAERISIPALAVEIRAKDAATGRGKRAYVLTNLTASGVKAGMAATLAFDALSATLDREGLTTGALKATQASLPALAYALLGQSRSEEGLLPVLAEGRVEKITLTRETSKLGIAAISLGALRVQSGKNPQHLFPVLGRIEISGISGTQNQTNWSLETLALAAEDAKSGIPGAFSASVKGLAVSSGPAGSKDMAELGYDPLRISGALEGGWDSAKQELSIGKFTVSGEQFGAMTFTALLGNVTRDAIQNLDGKKFFPDAMVRSMSVTLENTGVFERIVARSAKATNTTPEEARTKMIIQARLIASMMLGNQALTPLGEGINKFLLAPGRISISALARTPAGVPVSDFAKKTDKGPVIADQFTVTAEVR